MLIELEERVIVVRLGFLFVGLPNEQCVFVVDCRVFFSFFVIGLLWFYYEALPDGLCNINAVDNGDKGSMVSFLFNDPKGEDLFVWRRRFWTV